MTYEQLGFGMVGSGLAVYAVHVVLVYRARAARRRKRAMAMHPSTWR